MPLNESQRRIVQQSIDNLKNIWLSQGRERYFPNLLEAAKIEPKAVIQVVPVLAGYLDHPIRIHAFHALEMLTELALSAEILQKQINKSLNPKITELTRDLNPHVAKAAGNLLQVLERGKPFNYTELARNLRIHPSIFIIGAGFSYDSYAPLTRELNTILFNALFALGVKEPKKLFENNENECWKIIKGNPSYFKRFFSFLIANKEPSMQHYQLAELFHKNLITHIISFNWDNLLEKAYYKLYQKKIEKINRDGISSQHAFWKLHGDVEKLDEVWIFPYEEGRVFDSLLAELVDKPWVVLIIGYSEQERVVRNLLIKPLEAKNEVYRFRPNIAPKRGQPDNAKTVLDRLYRELI